MTTKELVDKYLQWGFNVLPAEDRAKYPVTKWEKYQREKYPREEIEEWLNHGKENWVVVCGAISWNLVVVDFDKPELYEQFKERIPEELLNTFIVKTGKKGYHVYYRTPEPVEATKIDKIDIQGEGKLAVLPPSIHPETGRRYEIINDKEPLSIDTGAWNHIFTTIKEIAEMEKEKEIVKDKLMRIVETIIPYWKKGQRDIMENVLVGYMRKKGVSKETAKGIIENIIRMTGDEEENIRMAVLERVYNLPPEKVAGYEGAKNNKITGLKEILSQRDLWKLEKYVKALSGDNIEIKEDNNEEKKKIKKVPYIAEEKIYLAVWDGKENYKFAHMNKTGRIELSDSVEINGVVYVPRERGKIPIGYPSDNILNAPSLTAKEVMERLKEHIWKYADMEESDLEMSIFFIMATWFYKKSNTVAYLRFLGDTGKGKSRMLKVIGDLTFYPLKLGGGASRSAIMRVQEQYHGTLILDESDFRGDKENDMIKYINSGFERDNPFMLTNKNTYQIEIFDPFSPKLFAMRHPFGDSATEGRLLSIEPYETYRRDIPAVLPLNYEEEVKELRDILARWTLENWDKVKMENREFIQSLPVEPRLKQLATPLSIILPLFDGEMKEKFTGWIMRRQEQILEDRSNSPEGIIFNAIVELLEGNTEDLSEKFRDYLYDPKEDGNDYLYSEEDEGKPLVITTGMLREMIGQFTRKDKEILKELGFKVQKKKLKIKDKQKTPHIILLENPMRWAENWRRYVDFREVGEIPWPIQDERIDYNMVPRVPEVPTTMHTPKGYQKKRITPLKGKKDKKACFSGVCKYAGTSGTAGTISSSSANNDDPFKHNGAKLEINNIRGFELAPDIPPVIHTDAPAGFTLTYIPSLAAIYPEPPQYEHVELLRDINGIALPDHNVPPVKRGEVIPVSKKVLKIMEKRGIAKRTTAEISFSVLIRNLPEEQIDVPDGMALGDTMVMWESSGCAKVEA